MKKKLGIKRLLQKKIFGLFIKILLKWWFADEKAE